MHIGKNICKIRELLGVKQESLAASLKISQQTISKIEQAKELSSNTIDRIAFALSIPPAVIKDFDEQLLVNYLKGANSFCAINEISPYLTMLEKIIDLFGKVLEVDLERMKQGNKLSVYDS